MNAVRVRDAILGLLVLTLPALGLGLYQLHGRLAALPHDLVEQPQLGLLQERLLAMSETNAGFTVMLDEHQQHLAVLETQTAALHAGIEQGEVALTSLQQAQASHAQRSELQSLAGRLSLAETQLRALQTALATRPAPKPRRTAPRRQPERLTPPFAALSIESRGGERFLTIAPTAIRSLRHVRLLRLGEQFAGWRLTTLDKQSAQFAVTGQPDQNLPLPGGNAP